MSNIVISEWGFREVRTVLAGVVVNPGPRPVTTLRYALAGMLSGLPIYPVNRGRSGLSLALKVFQEIWPDSKEVIVPAYICPSVADTIRDLGLEVVPVDVATDLNLSLQFTENAITPRTLAVVAAHMYGCPASVQKLERLCRQRGVFLIDDAAQVLGASLEGRPLGTFGDVGILSFSQSKTLVAGNSNAGGMLTVGNRSLERAIEVAWEDLPDPQNHRWESLRFLWESKVGKLAKKLKRVRKAISRNKRGASVNSPSKLGNLAAALALQQLQSLPNRYAGRVRVAEAYNAALKNYPRLQFPQYAEGRYLTRVVLLLPPGTNAMQVRSTLAFAGIGTRSGYPVVTSDKHASPTFALDIQSRLIEVPSHSNMSETEIARICEAVDRALSKLVELKSAENADLDRPSHAPARKLSA